MADERATPPRGTFAGDSPADLPRGTLAGDSPADPRIELAIRTIAMPADTNPYGDIFGGWVMAQMDLAGGITAARRARGRVATVAVTGFAFHKPVRVGDVVACHAAIERVGNTSITIAVEAWALRERHGERAVKVTEGVFTYVAIDAKGDKRAVPPA